jgi:shikimate kinase
MLDPRDKPTVRRHHPVGAQPELAVQWEKCVARGQVCTKKGVGIGAAGGALDDDCIAFVETISFVVRKEVRVLVLEDFDRVPERQLTRVAQANRIRHGHLA